jgi:hypothetical protein
VKSTSSQKQSDNCKQKVVAWTSRNRLVLLLASIFVPPAYVCWEQSRFDVRPLVRP